MSGFNFGTPQPTTTTQSGFSFSAPTPSNNTTGFNLGGGLTSSTPAQNPSTGGGGFSFGLAQPAAAAPATSTPGFSFGTPQATPAPNLTLGTAPKTTQATTTGFGFGQPAAPTTSAPAFNFGTTTATTATTGTGLQFGTPATAATTTTAPTLTLGGAATTTTASSGFAFGATSSAPSTGLTFGNPITSTSTSQPSTGLTFGGFGSQPAATTTATITLPTLTGFGSTQLSTAPTTTTTSVTQSGGLGGIDINATLKKPVEGKSESGKVKENQVPVEIMNTVEGLKAHIKQQKTLSSDIARTSTRKMLNVQKEIQEMVWNVQDLANKQESTKTAVKTLRKDTSEVIQHTDMAQRTHETPVGLQFENSAPLQYFIELTQKYENELVTLKKQMELTEKHMQSLTNPQTFTAEDLKRGLLQLHESFIALAGRLYNSHQKVEEQKEKYLNLRKYFLNDKTNVFGSDNEANAVKDGFGSIVSVGPTPFSTLGNISYGFNLSGTQYPSTSQQPGIMGVAAQNQQQSSQFGFNNNNMNNQSAGSGFFNLQTPPFLGQKRNKP